MLLSSCPPTKDEAPGSSLESLGLLTSASSSSNPGQSLLCLASSLSCLTWSLSIAKKKQSISYKRTRGEPSDDSCSGCLRRYGPQCSVVHLPSSLPRKVHFSPQGSHPEHLSFLGQGAKGVGDRSNEVVHR